MHTLARINPPRLQIREGKILAIKLVLVGDFWSSSRRRKNGSLQNRKWPKPEGRTYTFTSVNAGAGGSSPALRAKTRQGFVRAKGVALSDPQPGAWRVWKPPETERIFGPAGAAPRWRWPQKTAPGARAQMPNHRLGWGRCQGRFCRAGEGGRGG